MEHERNFDRLVEASRSDYDELLRRGCVIRVDVDDTAAWRSEIRRQARADRVKVRTQLLRQLAGGVAAILEREPDQAEIDSGIDQADAFTAARDRASLRGHRIRGFIRFERGRGAARCADCACRLYVDSTADPLLLDGEVFEFDCPTFVV